MFEAIHECLHCYIAASYNYNNGIQRKGLICDKSDMQSEKRAANDRIVPQNLSCKLYFDKLSHDAARKLMSNPSEVNFGLLRSA